MISSRTNPFPAGTVVSDSIAGLPNYLGGNFHSAKTLLDIYKENFSSPTTRCGGTMGIRGPFGSGKTHLVFQLADYFRTSMSLQGKAIYAKPDHADFIDLYTNHFARRFDEQDLKTLAAMHIAVLLRARRSTRSTSIKAAGPGESLTEIALIEVDSAVRDNPEFVLSLVSDDLLPAAGLSKEFEAELEVASEGVGRDFFRAYSRIMDPGMSKMAIRWLHGEELSKSERQDLGLVLSSIRQPSHAKEAMRYLLRAHSKANLPILFCIDEFERFAQRGTSDDRAASPGMLKDIAEMFFATGHFFLLSGVDSAWNGMPADLFDRIRRADIIGMQLDKKEETQLLEVYCNNVGASLNDVVNSDALQLLLDVSNGNARRMLHIAHTAVALCRAPVVSPADIMAGVDKALSTPDRINKLRDSIQSVAKRAGLSVQKGYVHAGVVPDFTLGPPDSPLVVVNITSSVFRADEVQRSRELARQVRHIQKDIPSTRTCSIIVGYSSSEVRAELQQLTDALFVYDEETFESDFEGFVRSAPVLPAAAEERLKTHEEVYTRIEAKFDQLEGSRQSEIARLTQLVNKLQADVGARSETVRVQRVEDKALDALSSLRQLLKIEEEMATREITKAAEVPSLDEVLGILDAQRDQLRRLEILDQSLIRSLAFSDQLRKYRELLELAETDFFSANEQYSRPYLSGLRQRREIRDSYRSRRDLLDRMETTHRSRSPFGKLVQLPVLCMAVSAIGFLLCLFSGMPILSGYNAALNQYQASLAKFRQSTLQILADPSPPPHEAQLLANSFTSSWVQLEDAASGLAQRSTAGGQLEIQRKSIAESQPQVTAQLRASSAYAQSSSEAARKIVQWTDCCYRKDEIGNVSAGSPAINPNLDRLRGLSHDPFFLLGFILLVGAPLGYIGVHMRKNEAGANYTPKSDARSASGLPRSAGS